MQSLRQCIRRLTLYNKCTTNTTDILSSIWKPSCVIPSHNIHQSTPLNEDKENAFKFLDYNKVVYPPQKPGEERRPAFVCHMRENVKYSPLKMWYLACFVRGMSVDEAVKQLSFMHKKGAAIIKDVILEAQTMAVEEHNVEYKSNLWVAESYAVKGLVIKGLRRHAKMRAGRVRYMHTHYFVRLEEGEPPKHYYLPHPKTGDELLQDWLQKMHARKVINSL